MPRTIEVSHRTVVFIFLFAALVWFLLQIWPIIIGLFVAFLLMTALNPWVDKLVRLKVPRALAILFIYILLIGFFVVGLASVVPPLVEQTTNLVDRLPELFGQVVSFLEGLGIRGVDGKALAAQLTQVGTIPASVVRFTVSIFANLVALFTLLVITFYLLLERRNLNKYLVILFGTGGEARARTFVDRLEAKLGGWVRGEITLMIIVGTLTYIGLRLLGIPFSLPLAILAGLLELIPNIGPTISAIPAVLIGLSLSPFMGLATVALYFLVQQLENGVIVPKIMEKVVGVNPLVTIIALAVGFKIAGPVGAILAIPVVLTIQVVAVELFASERFKQL